MNQLAQWKLSVLIGWRTAWVQMTCLPADISVSKLCHFLLRIHNPTIAPLPIFIKWDSSTNQFRELDGTLIQWGELYCLFSSIFLIGKCMFFAAVWTFPRPWLILIGLWGDCINWFNWMELRSGETIRTYNAWWASNQLTVSFRNRYTFPNYGSD